MDTTDNPKARGLKHIKNKKKNSKHKPSAHSVPPKSTKPATLDSNWDRYDQEFEKKTIDSSTDFSILANAPITRGSHFQFKCDRIDDETTTETNNSLELFKLDLNLLEKSLATIPFSSRCGIDDKYFSETQHKIMAATAKNNNDIYLSYLNTLPQNSVIEPFGNLNLNDEEEENEIKNDLFDGAKCELSPSQKPNENTDLRTLVTKVDEKNEDDLEQWLDTILDE